jgi:hypothetical protein
VSRSVRARRYALRHWDAVGLGFFIALFVTDGVVQAACSAGVTVSLAFGLGVRSVAIELARDFNVMRRHIEHLEGVNRRMCERARERARRDGSGHATHVPEV